MTEKFLTFALLLAWCLLSACTSSQEGNLNSENLLSPTIISSTSTFAHPPVTITVDGEPSHTKTVEPTIALIEAVDTPTAVSTPTITPGKLIVLSEPEGATLTVVEDSIVDQTPYSTTLSPGDYTLNLNLDGYETLTETVHIIAGQTISIQAELVYQYRYISLEKLDGSHALTYLAWESDGQAIIYATENGFYSTEAKDWAWWRYDLSTEEKLQLPPPESQVNLGVRQNLELCPSMNSNEMPSASCPGFSLLFESPTSNRIVFTPLTTGDGIAWLANIDGSNALKIKQLALAPSYVQWSPDGQWLVISLHIPALPGQHDHYLVSADGSFVEHLGRLTNSDHFIVNGLFPQFSPDGQKIAYVGSRTPGSYIQDDYKLYTLDLNTFESNLVSEKFGFFQWSDDSQGLYVLDGAVYPIATEADYSSPEILGRHSANLYFVDLTQPIPQEHLIAGNIFYYPRNNRGSWIWAYSPVIQAIAYVGFQNEEELGILFLSASVFNDEE